MVNNIHTLQKRKAAPKQPEARRSNISTHDYNPKTEHLTVTFHNGQKYRYEGVRPETYNRFKSADSQGSFFHAHIRGAHDFTKLDP